LHSQSFPPSSSALLCSRSGSPPAAQPMWTRSGRCGRSRGLRVANKRRPTAKPSANHFPPPITLYSQPSTPNPPPATLYHHGVGLGRGQGQGQGHGPFRPDNARTASSRVLSSLDCSNPSSASSECSPDSRSALTSACLTRSG